MDIKQLVTGNPKTGFYPVTQDTITVIELNKSVMSLTNESSSEEIIAAFDNLESFQALIAEVRNPQNICSGILVNETPEDKRVGKYEATIIANTNSETLHVRWVENDRIIALSITNTDGTMSCIRNENNVGGGSGESDVYVFDAQKESITLEEYTALENAIKENKIILCNTDILKCLIIATAIIGNDIGLMTTDGDLLINIQINKEDLKVKTETYKFIKSEDVLTKDNITPFTPNADYQPATKKYVDDKEKNVVFDKDISSLLSGGFDINDYTKKQINISFSTVRGIQSINFYNGDINTESNYLFTVQLISKLENGDLSRTHLQEQIIELDNSIYNYNGIASGKTKYKITGGGDKALHIIEFTPIECVISESNYNSLGTIPNTDNVLYFVTPDA